MIGLCIVSTYWLLWLVWLQRVVYRYLFEHLYSIIFGLYLEVQLLDHIAILCLIFRGPAKLFHKACIIYIPTNSVQILIAPYICQHCLVMMMI